MKRITSTMLAIVLVLVALLSVACQPSNSPEQKYSVTFETFDGKSTTVEVLEGQTARQPADPSNQQAKFKGWYADKNYQTQWDKATPITSDTIIYAKWEYKYDVVITFKLNNGEEAIKSTAHTGFLVTLPANPTRTYYEFAGWYTDAECTQKFDETKVLTYRGAFSLYAGWTVSDGHTHDFKFVKTVQPTCEDLGYDVYSCICGTSEQRNVVQPCGHKTSAGDDYIRFYTCSVCSKLLRKESLRTYDEVFKYEFNQDKADEYDLLYQEILDILDKAEKYSDTYKRTWDAVAGQYDTSKDVVGLYDENKAFEDKFNTYYDKVLDVIEQYQYAYVFYCVHDGESSYEEDYEFVSEYRTDMVKNFYSLYRLIHETKYREFFFAFDEGWTDEDIQSALIMSDSYGGEEYAELNKKADDIQVSFRTYSTYDAAFGDGVPVLYEKYVDVNNQIAKLAGYDNYMDYAYENIYDRDYTPTEVATMRNFVKQYVGPLYCDINDKDSHYLTDDEKTYYNALSQSSMFTNELTAKLVADYFDILYSEANQAGKKEINFTKHANDLFKNGNYYTGDYEGAFSYYIRAQETSILYFGPGSYSGAFTFVHEFGHYYETVYNPGVSVSYDLEETHSQGDEMLFLAHLSKVLAENDCLHVFENLMYEQVLNSMWIVLLATAVDEFEQIAYTATYDGKNSTIKGLLADGKVTADEYDKIFVALLKEYCPDGSLDDYSYYWRLVTIEAAGYYISYAMSALPAIELFVKGMQDFDSAKQSYFKLFTFTDNDKFVETDEQGDLVVTAGYAETLQYAGLYSPFQEGLYTTLKDYFETL